MTSMRADGFDESVDSPSDDGVCLLRGVMLVVNEQEGNFHHLTPCGQTLQQRQFLQAIRLTGEALYPVAVHGMLESLLGSDCHDGASGLSAIGVNL